MSGNIEKTIAKLYAIKRNPRKLVKKNKKGEEIEFFIADFRHDGKRQQICSTNLSDFYQKIDDVIRVLQEGTIKGNEKSKILVEDAFNMFLTQYRGQKLQEYPIEKQKKLLKNTLYELQDFLAKIEKVKPIKFLSDINSEEIRVFATSMMTMGVQNETVNRRLSTISALFNFINEMEVYEVNDVKFKKFFLKKPPARTNYLTEKQIEDLLKICPKHLQNIVNYLRYTGLRKDGYSSLKWSNIDFEKRIITLQVKQNKTHSVPIISKLFDLLQEIKKEQKENQSEYVFTYKEKPIKDAKKSLKTALKQANIELPKGQLFHVFRHTAATNLINAGVDMFTVQKFLGHSNPKMTQKYAHLSTSKVLLDMEEVFGGMER